MEGTVNITIDGGPVAAQAGMTVIDACDQAGVYVPRLCAYPGLEPVGDCGLCFVKIEGGGSRTGGEARRACSVVVREGMSVSTTDADALTYRRNSMAAILGDHPHVCLTCPERDGCSRDECTYGNALQVRCCEEFSRCEIAGVAAWVGALDTAPAYRFRALGETVDHHIRRDLDLCVGCGRCVAACDTLEEAGRALKMVETATLVGRDLGRASHPAAEPVGTADERRGNAGAPSGGVDEGEAEWRPQSYLGRNVAVPKERDLRASGCTFCAACVMVCPSGALTAAGTKGRVWLAKRRQVGTLRPPELPPEDRLLLSAAAVEKVSARAGVFLLYDAAGAILQISGVMDVRAGLANVLSGPMGGEAVSFTWEDQPLYTQRESELLAHYLQEHGSLPRGNDVPDDLFGGDEE